MTLQPQPIALRRVTPACCSYAFGIPASQADYARHMAAPPGIHDYARKVAPRGARDYDFAVGRHFSRVLPALQASGAHVRTAVTLADFARLFSNPARPIVVLFSHWSEDCVEFDDGLAPVADVIKAVPQTFEGILDLCVCHPDSLVRGLAVERPCLGAVKFTDTEASPDLWLYAHLAMCKLLRDGSRTYHQALESVVGQFLDCALQSAERGGKADG